MTCHLVWNWLILYKLWPLQRWYEKLCLSTTFLLTCLEGLKLLEGRLGSKGDTQLHTWLRHWATGRNIIGYFNWPNLSSRAMSLGSTQPLTEMITRNPPGGKERLAYKGDNLTAICEPIVRKMWEPQRLTNLWAFTACYGDS
jgi:hypothetical protein